MPLNKEIKPSLEGEMSPCGIVANVLNYNTVESEFKLHLCYYIHF